VILGALYHCLLLRSGPLNRLYARFVVNTMLAGAQSPGVN
jgi:hypothetical protein